MIEFDNKTLSRWMPTQAQPSINLKNFLYIINFNGPIQPASLKRMDDNMDIEKLKKYLDSESDDIRKEFIEGLLKIISSNVESVLPSELRDFLSAWAETAEICLDDEIMYNIKQAENEIKAGGGNLWMPPQNLI